MAAVICQNGCKQRCLHLGPALAGVAPFRTSGGFDHVARPRARGGCSGDGSVSITYAISAPRSRGLLPAPGVEVEPVLLGPALAGVAPGRRRAARTAAPRPRARGGCSTAEPGGAPGARSAPRSRGLLPHGTDHTRSAELGPALAGVAPLFPLAAPPPIARPRARGGCSADAAPHTVTIASAPRSRGLLRLGGGGLPRPGLGPALAGVARSPPAPRRSSPTRPRARGGCSPFSGTRGPVQFSAPRSRGLLLCPRIPIPRPRLGPALAGVAHDTDVRSVVS